MAVQRASCIHIRDGILQEAFEAMRSQRCIILVAPVVVFIVTAPAGPMAAVLVTGLLNGLERSSSPDAALQAV